MTTFVLVHGGFHGGWCWGRVAKRLRAAGHDVYAPTLTGLADRSHLLNPHIDLSTHVSDVAGLLRWEDLHDVVLCGHSYGGMVVTGAAEAEAARVRTIVYADAFVPESGQCLLDLLPPDRRDRMTADAETAGEGWRLTIPPASAYDLADAADRAWVDSLLTPHPYGTCTERMGRLQAVQGKPRVFIRATRYSASTFAPVAERARNGAGWTLHEVPCGHDLMIEQPSEVTRILLAAAGASERPMGANAGGHNGATAGE